MSIFFYVPQYFTTQLSVAGGIDDTQTTGIVLQDISGVDATKPGIIALTWSNPIDTTKIEYIFYTSINESTKELQGVTRGQEGYSAKSHLNGATVAWPLSKSHINNIPDSTTTFTNKTLTSPKINEDVALTATATQLNNLVSGAYDGWTSAGETWTRESDNTFSEPIDATLKYQKGDKIRYKQGAEYKYQYIISVGSYSAGKTIITTTGGSDYVFTNGTSITDNYYSHQSNPVGFPGYFSWVPTLTGGNADLSGYNTATFTIDGSRLFLYFACDNKSLSGTNGDINISLPVPTIQPSSFFGNYIYFISNYTVARCELTTVLVLHKGMTSETWAANETGVYIRVYGNYLI